MPISTQIRRTPQLFVASAFAALVPTAAATQSNSNLPIPAAATFHPEKGLGRETQKTLRDYGLWHSSIIGGGGFVQNVVFTSDPKILYSYVDVGGVFRSNDGGKRWRMLHASLPGRGIGVTCVRDVNVNPSNPDELLVCAGTQWAPSEGIFLSKDGGQTWSQTLHAHFYGNEPLRNAGRNLARSPKNPQHLLAFSGGDGLFLSTDGGQTWISRGLEGSYPTDVVFARDGKTAFACTQPRQVWRHGKEVSLGGGFFGSRDGGETWKLLNEKAPREMLQDPQEAERWWSIWDGTEIRTSTNGNLTWEIASQGLPVGEFPVSFTSESCFEALAAGPNFIVTASRRGTFYRLDLPGRTWHKLAKPVVVQEFEGQPWINRTESGKWPHFGASLSSISINPKNPAQWYFTDWYAIYKSSDSGASWALSMDGLETTVVHTLVPDPVDSGRVHLGLADIGYLRSEDGGSRFQSPRITSNFKCLSISAADPHRLYATGDRSNGTWRSDQVWISSDAGGTWSRSPMTGLPRDETFVSISVAPDDPQLVYLTASGPVRPGSGGIYRSTDGGSSWDWYGGGLEGDVPAFASDIFGTGRELATLPGGEVWAVASQRKEVWHLPAGESKWEIASHLAAFEVAADPSSNCVYVTVPGDGLWLHTRGTSRRVWQGEAKCVAVGSHSQLAIGGKDNVWLSQDGGQTWKSLPGLPHHFAPVVAFSGDRLVAGTRGNGVFWYPLTNRAYRQISAKPVAPASTGARIQDAAGQDAPKSVPLAGDWVLGYVGFGKLTLEKDTAVFASPPDSWRLSTAEGKAGGSAVLGVPLWKGQRTFFAKVKLSGNPEIAQVAIQAFGDGGKQSGWKTLWESKTPTDWSVVQGDWELPADTRRVQLVLRLRGEGQAWIDDVAATAEDMAQAATVLTTPARTTGQVMTLAQNPRG